MTISKEQLFSQLVDQLGGSAAVARDYRINRRTMARMLNGSQPPPNRLLDEMRRDADQAVRP